MNANYSNASMLDMVFEHRNKAYGAYILRRDADKSVKQSMLFILSAISLLCFGNYLKENMAGKKKMAGEHIIDSHLADVTLKEHKKEVTPPPPPKPPRVQQAAAIPTVRRVEMRITADNNSKDSMPPTRELPNLESGLTTNTTATAGIGLTDSKGTEQVFEVAREAVPAPPQVYTFVEQMPEYPGGEGELLKYIARSIQYPSMELQNDIEGKVITQFTVNEDGTVSDIKVLRSPSPGLGNEATRVLRTLKPFRPGIQQGKAVKVRYNVPIYFKLN